MLTDELKSFYRKLRLVHYRELFGRIREKDGSLSATEAFTADAIYLLQQSTVSELADTLGISQPNATYKVNNLCTKGYVTRGSSEEDRRECRIAVAEKFHRYYDTDCAFLAEAVQKLKEKFSPEEISVFEKMMGELNRVLR